MASLGSLQGQVQDEEQEARQRDEHTKAVVDMERQRAASAEGNLAASQAAVSDLVARLKDAELEIRDLSLYVAHLQRQKEIAEEARRGTASACALLEDELTSLSACVRDVEEEREAERRAFDERFKAEAARREEDAGRCMEEKKAQNAAFASRLSMLIDEAGVLDRELRSEMDGLARQLEKAAEHHRIQVLPRDRQMTELRTWLSDALDNNAQLLKDKYLLEERVTGLQVREGQLQLRLSAIAAESQSEAQQLRSEVLKFQALAVEVEDDCKRLRGQLAEVCGERDSLEEGVERERREMEAEMDRRVREAEERVRIQERWRETERAAAAALDRIATRASGGMGGDSGMLSAYATEISGVTGVVAAASAARERAAAALDLERGRAALSEAKEEWERRMGGRIQERERMRGLVRGMVDELNRVIVSGGELRQEMEVDVCARQQLEANERRRRSKDEQLDRALAEKDAEIQSLLEEIAADRSARERERKRQKERDKEQAKARERESAREREQEQARARERAREEAREEEFARLVCGVKATACAHSA